MCSGICRYIYIYIYIYISGFGFAAAHAHEHEHMMYGSTKQKKVSFKGERMKF